MSYQKQPELNGGYYGPPIPPPRSYNRPRRGGSGCGGCCCLFDCLCDCGCCLLGCVCKVIFSILIVIGLVILIFWLLVRPHEVKFHATSAELSTFNFSSGNNMNYNLAVNFTAYNPNRKIGIYYDNIEASAIYAGQRISTTHANTFYQGHKNTTSFGPVVFKGQNQAVALGSIERGDFENQNSDGVFDIQVKLRLRVRFKLGLFKTGTYKPKVKCDLKVPLKGGKSSEKFKETRCDYDLF